VKAGHCEAMVRWRVREREGARHVREECR
jgi:hypothetical protein